MAVKTQQIYYNLLLQGYMFRLLRVNIQGDSGGICNTLGNDSMCDSKKKNLMNMGPIFEGYGVMTA